MNNNNSIKRHEAYKKLNEFIYKPKERQCPDGAVWLYKSENSKTGFYAGAFKYQGRIVIVFRGSDTKTDLKSDIKMKEGNIPEQMTDAIRFVNQIKEVMKKYYPEYKLDLSGQSLGGSLAQMGHVMISGINETVTFQPYGTALMLEDYLSKHTIKNPVENISNYCNQKDFITGKTSFNKQIGNCYEIGTRKRKIKDIGIYYHRTENLKPLSERKPANGIYQSPLQKQQKLYSSSCTGTYSVSGYTREDGTKVSGYTRTCSKHGKEKYEGMRFQDIPPEELEEAISYFI